MKTYNLLFRDIIFLFNATPGRHTMPLFENNFFIKKIINTFIINI